MSKILNAGTLFGGIGGLVAGAVAVFQIAAPANINTPEDLISALGSIETAIQSLDLGTDSATAKKLETAVDNFTSQVALATRGDNGTLAYVPRSFSGVKEYQNGDVFDFVAPNGVSKLIRVNVLDKGVSFLIDGDRTSYITPGQQLKEGFGNSSCKLENISFEPGTKAVLRITCS